MIAILSFFETVKETQESVIIRTSGRVGWMKTEERIEVGVVVKPEGRNYYEYLRKNCGSSPQHVSYR